ncbi:MAG: pseudouridine synthase [Balneolaceae bacterium]
MSKPNRPVGGGRKKRPRRNPKKAPHEVGQEAHLEDEIRINKYIAHSGFCSRRNADKYLEEGRVYVNGKQVTEHGVKVSPTDEVKVDGQHISLEPFVYILLNKSKDTISTTDDERDRNTVLDAVETATGYRVYPVGRLDRHTMGLLILTNDGDLANRLMHPSYRVQKVYDVVTDTPLKDHQLKELTKGVELEDGPAKVSHVVRNPRDSSNIAITVHEGRNHLIRRLVGYFGAEVEKLKRVQYAGLTDQNLRVGEWRYLNQQEINELRRLVKLNTINFYQK